MKVTKKSIWMWAVGCYVALYCVLTPVSAFAFPPVAQWAAAGCQTSLGASPYAQQSCQAVYNAFSPTNPTPLPPPAKTAACT